MRARSQDMCGVAAEYSAARVDRLRTSMCPSISGATGSCVNVIYSVSMNTFLTMASLHAANRYDPSYAGISKRSPDGP